MFYMHLEMVKFWRRSARFTTVWSPIFGCITYHQSTRADSIRGIIQRWFTKPTVLVPSNFAALSVGAVPPSIEFFIDAIVNIAEWYWKLPHWIRIPNLFNHQGILVPICVLLCYIVQLFYHLNQRLADELRKLEVQEETNISLVQTQFWRAIERSTNPADEWTFALRSSTR